MDGSTITKILDGLPSQYQPNSPEQLSSTIKKCLEKLRILNTKVVLTNLGRHDHLQSRAAICLEHVVRRDIPDYPARISIDQLAKCIGMSKTNFSNVKNKMDHFLEDTKTTQNSSAYNKSNSSTHRQDKGNFSSVSNTSKSTDLLGENTGKFIQKLCIKIGSQEDCDTEKATKNAQILLTNIKEHLKNEKIYRIREASQDDLRQNAEIYIAACFYLECIDSSITKKVKEELLTSVVTAAKLTHEKFLEVLEHVKGLKCNIREKNSSTSQNASKLDTRQNTGKRKRSTTLKQDGNGALHDIMSSNPDKQRSNKRSIDSGDDTTTIDFAHIIDEINSKNDDFTNHLKTTDTAKNPPFDVCMSFLKSKSHERDPDLSSTFCEWKNNILEKAKHNARKWAVKTRESEDMSDISDREALSIAAKLCL